MYPSALLFPLYHGHIIIIYYSFILQKQVGIMVLNDFCVKPYWFSCYYNNFRIVTLYVYIICSGSFGIIWKRYNEYNTVYSPFVSLIQKVLKRTCHKPYWFYNICLVHKTHVYFSLCNNAISNLKRQPIKKKTTRNTDTSEQF